MSFVKSTLSKFSFAKIMQFLLQIIIVFALYITTIIVGNKGSIEQIYTLPIWLPSGILFSAVLIFGKKIIPAIFIGAFLSINYLLNFSIYSSTIGNTFIPSLFIAIGDTLEILLAYYLFNKFIPKKNLFDNLSALTKFFVISAFISLVGATIGTSSLAILDKNISLNYTLIWLSWVLSHLTAYVIITPLIQGFRAKSFVIWKSKIVIEAISLIVIIIVLSLIIFGKVYPEAIIFSSPYLIVPLLLWAVTKFSHREVTIILVVLSGIAIIYTSQGNGPFYRGTMEESILRLQGYLLIISASTLLLYSAISELRNTENELRSYKDDLELKVEERSNEIKQKNKSLQLEIEVRIKTEKKLKELSEAVEQSPASVIITDKNGTILYANPKFIQIKGYSQNEVLGKNPRFFKSGVHDEKFYRILWDTINKGKIWQGEILNKKKNGDIFWELVLISPLLNDDGEIYRFVGIYEDITKQKEAEDEIQKYLVKLSESEFKLNELNQNKDKFFSILAHDLKGPFSSLLGFSEFLVNGFEELSLNEIKSYSINIHESTKNTYKLLENLLEWGKVQRNLIDLDFENFDLFEIAEKTIELYSTKAKNKNIAIDLQIAKNCNVYADKNTISTVFRNLVSNALKFCQKDDVVTLSSKKVGNDIEISISDTGLGISEDDLSKLFRIDVHHTNYGTAHEKGTGLGLILCKDLLEKNNGYISVESELGSGSTFKFVLPAAKT